jgi:hypothetical protein
MQASIRRKRWAIGATLLLILTALQVQAETPLREELSFFQPYLGDWIGEFESGKGEPAITDTGHWESALNGMALRTTHALSTGTYAGESFFVWDEKTQRITFFYFTTAGFHTTGHIEIVDDRTFIAYEDVTGNADGITQVKSTSRFSGDNIEISTQYLKNGEWTPPASRTYRRPDSD